MNVFQNNMLFAHKFFGKVNRNFKTYTIRPQEFIIFCASMLIDQMLIILWQNLMLFRSNV